MYRIVPQAPEILKELETQGYVHTVFMTYAWVSFLEKNQKATPVILQLLDEQEHVTAYFVGMIVKKLGIKILGSPFEGWLTCDMGFIRISELDINCALRCVAKYAFKRLGCWYVQIIDSSIVSDNLDSRIKSFPQKLLYIDNKRSINDVLNDFTKNGRRDVRASFRKGAIFQQVPFDRRFVQVYYDQLIDVFAKQNMKPFYSLEKLYDLVDAFYNTPERVLALEAYNPEGKIIATVFSFGYGKWAYFVGAASYREYQKYLPNEGLFFSFLKHWNELEIFNVDLVGYREYKMKYAPKMIEIPVVYFQRFPGIYFAKKTAKVVIANLRKKQKQ